MLRTPRHEYGPTATPATYATPRANPLGASINGGINATPGGPATANHTFDFLQHPLFADPESLQGGLQFDGLYAKMANFKENLDAYVEESCTRLEQAKVDQAAVKEERQHEIKQLDKEIDTEKKARYELMAAIASERAEDAEAKRVQSEKERQAHSLSSQLSDIQSELDEIRKQFVLRREERRRVAGKMREMAKLNVPERELLESRTGCRIDSPGDDLISFTFSMLDPNRPREQAFFIFALQKRTYTMPVVQPPLPESATQPLLDELNRSRNAFKHIKGMRRLLKQEIERGARATMTLEEAASELGVKAATA